MSITLNAENRFVELLLTRHRRVAEVQVNVAEEIDYLLPIIMKSNGATRAIAQKELDEWKKSLDAACAEVARLITLERQLGITYGLDVDCNAAPVFERPEITIEDFLFVMFEALLREQPMPAMVARARSHDACTHP